MCSWNQMYDSAVVPEPGGPGGPLAPPIFGRSVNPTRTRGGQIIPTYYSSVPNRRACTIINFGGKSPVYMTLFGPTRLLILRNFFNLHVYSILQAY